MFKSSEGFKLKNDITSEEQLLADDQNNLVVLNEIRRARPSIQTDPQTGTNGYVKLKERHFLICQSCFWCASYFENELTDTKCPLCDEGKVDCMLIGEDNSYCFNYRKIEVLH